MKEKLPLKIVSILGKNKPRGRTSLQNPPNLEPAFNLVYCACWMLVRDDKS